jgi:hypothetical protein
VPPGRSELEYRAWCASLYNLGGKYPSYMGLAIMITFDEPLQTIKLNNSLNASRNASDNYFEFSELERVSLFYIHICCYNLVQISSWFLKIVLKLHHGLINE